MLLYAYVIESDEIIDRFIINEDDDVDDQVKELCEDFFLYVYAAKEETPHSTRYIVSDEEQIVTSSLDEDAYEALIAA